MNNTFSTYTISGSKGEYNVIDNLTRMPVSRLVKTKKEAKEIVQMLEDHCVTHKPFMT